MQDPKTKQNGRLQWPLPSVKRNGQLHSPPPSTKRSGQQVWSDIVVLSKLKIPEQPRAASAPTPNIRPAHRANSLIPKYYARYTFRGVHCGKYVPHCTFRGQLRALRNAHPQAHLVKPRTSHLSVYDTNASHLCRVGQTTYNAQRKLRAILTTGELRVALRARHVVRFAVNFTHRAL